jgi:hypothetical protein
MAISLNNHIDLQVQKKKQKEVDEDCVRGILRDTLESLKNYEHIKDAKKISEEIKKL